MNLIEQLQNDVSQHQRRCEERLVQLAEEQKETRKVLRSIKAYSAKLGKQHGNDEAALPLGDPDEPGVPEMSQEEIDESDAMHAAHPVVGHDNGHETRDDMADAWEPTVEEYQARRVGQPPSQVDPERPRRRKTRAAAEEIGNG